MLLPLLAINQTPSVCPELHHFYSQPTRLEVINFSTWAPKGVLLKTFYIMCQPPVWVDVGLALINTPIYVVKSAVCLYLYNEIYKEYERQVIKCYKTTQTLFHKKVIEYNKVESTFKFLSWQFREMGGCEWRSSTLCLNFSDAPTVSTEFSFKDFDTRYRSLENAVKWYTLMNEKIKDAQARMMDEYKSMVKYHARECNQMLKLCKVLDDEEMYLLVNYSCDVPEANGTNIGEKIEGLRQSAHVCLDKYMRWEKMLRYYKGLVQQMALTSKCKPREMSTGEAIYYYRTCQPPNTTIASDIYYYMSKIREIDPQKYKSIKKEVDDWNDPAALDYIKEEYSFLLTQLNRTPEKYLKIESEETKGICDGVWVNITRTTTITNPLPYTISYNKTDIKPWSHITLRKQIKEHCSVNVNIKRHSYYGEEWGTAHISIHGAELALVHLTDVDTGPCYPVDDMYVCSEGVAQWISPSSITYHVGTVSHILNTSYVMISLCSDRLYDSARIYIPLGSPPLSVAGVDNYEITQEGILLNERNLLGCKSFTVTILTNQSIQSLYETASQEVKTEAEKWLNQGDTSKALKVLLDHQQTSDENLTYARKYTALVSSLPNCSGPLCGLFPMNASDSCSDCKAEYLALKKSMAQAWKNYNYEIKNMRKKYKDLKNKHRDILNEGQSLGLIMNHSPYNWDALFMRAQQNVEFGNQLWHMLKNYSNVVDEDGKRVSQVRSQLIQNITTYKNKIADLLPLYNQNYEDAKGTAYLGYFSVTPSYIRSVLARKTEDKYLWYLTKRVWNRMNATLESLSYKASEKLKTHPELKRLYMMGRYVKVLTLEKPKDDTQLWWILGVGIISIGIICVYPLEAT